MNPSKTPPQRIIEAKQDFWDLGDDDLDLEPEEAPEENKTQTTESNNDTPKIGKTELENDLEIKTEDQTPAAKAEPQRETAESIKSETDSVRKKKSSSSSPQKKAAPTSIFEKINLLIVVACLLGALGWGISTFLQSAPQGKLISFEENYPAKGQNVTISSVETWWKKPVRSGENTDRDIVLGSHLVPCAKITLSEANSTTLRVTFRNGEKKLIGDTINLNIQGGKFTRSGTDFIEVHATAGFDNTSKINSYANGDIDPWSITITESDAGNEGEPLVKARISATSKDQ